MNIIKIFSKTYNYFHCRKQKKKTNNLSKQRKNDIVFKIKIYK